MYNIKGVLDLEEIGFLDTITYFSQKLLKFDNNEEKDDEIISGSNNISLSPHLIVTLRDFEYKLENSDGSDISENK